MPPRKTATKQDENPAELIIAYLGAQNRPYSAIDISCNLHNKVTKAKADKLLKELKMDEKIMGTNKATGNVYWALQDPADTATSTELAGYDASINDLREAIPPLKASHKAKSTILNQIRSTMTNEALRDAVDNLVAKRVELEDRLVFLRNGDVKPITRQERDEAEERYRYWQRKSTARRRVWLEFEGLLLEGLGRDELYGKLGIDDDSNP